MLKTGDYVMVGRTVAVVTEVSYGYAVVRPALFNSIEREFPEDELIPATVTDVTREATFDYGNVPCKLAVESRTIAEEFATDYNGEHIMYGGVYGRVGDVPAYIGAEIVRSVAWEYVLGERTLVIAI